MTIPYLRTADVRRLFVELLAEGKFTAVNREGTMTALTGNTTIELIGSTFIADEDVIFGEVNWDYVKREEEWYNSRSLSVNHFPGGAPQVWKAVADKNGYINSNYGHLIYSPANGGFYGWEFTESIHGQPITSCQYDEVVKELKKNPASRRAVMIYTRPSMWKEYDLNGRSDFICTNTVQYLIRDGKLHAVVQMRSNDSIFGYRNDRAWQMHILNRVAADLSVEPGDLYWQAGSLHVYARHYYLIDPVNYQKP